ncbi:MAG TPA: glycoside hydrolase family 3 C-terminal domain-containing protein [Caulobacteraceae bacterium]|nr:glycoside hydrolase family 3 C-terminal domain-containing protein [Caulobacteraceae bacterium]
MKPRPNRDRAVQVLGLGAMLAALSCGLAWPAETSGSARVDALLAKMSLEDKIALIHGVAEPAATDQGQAGYLPGLAKYGIPPVRLTDGPPGVLTRLPATAFPATMALAATFSVEDARANGVAIGRSAKARGQQIVLEPFINIHRDPLFERAYNTYGEDPLLTGAIAAGMVQGIQSQGVMAQAKHFIAYDGADNVEVGPQALREIYVAPFKAVVDAGVSSLMCSYNRINGPYACGSDAVLEGILRKELGFKGFVTSDWGAVHASDFVAKGLDMEMPGTPGKTAFMSARPVAPPVRPPNLFAFAGGIYPEEPSVYRARAPQPAEVSTGLLDAIASGQASEADITRAAGHILHEYERFGYLDKAPSQATTGDPAEQAAPTVLKTGEDAAVLLKNDGALPLRPAQSDVAVIGPGGGQLMAVGMVGEKALGHIERQVSPVQALRAAGMKVAYAVADDMDGAPVPASVLSHAGAPGLVRADGTVDAQLDHTVKAGAPLPAGGNYVWSGELNIPAARRYRLHLQVIGGSARMTLDGKPAASTSGLALHGNVLQPGQDNIVPTTDGLDNERVEYALTAGPHPITITLTGDDSGVPVQVRLAWVTPQKRQADYDAAIATARAAKTVVVFAWSRNRPAFGLPGDQDTLIEDIAAAAPNTIVVLNTAEPVAMPWLAKVKAVVQMWFPGDEGGWATADILTGKADPAGRLPFTWPVRLADNVAEDPAHPERASAGVGGKTVYSEGIMVGYRWFDSQGIQPLFPFGYGLSYTRFDYSELKVSPAAKGAVSVTFRVKNAGPADGDEVPQLYLGAPALPPADGQVAPRALVGFTRLHLKAGESRRVQLTLPARRFQYWSVRAKGWVKVAGARKLMVGASSRDIRRSVSLGG